MSFILSFMSNLTQLKKASLTSARALEDNLLIKNEHKTRYVLHMDVVTNCDIGVGGPHHSDVHGITRYVLHMVMVTNCDIGVGSPYHSDVHGITRYVLHMDMATNCDIGVGGPHHSDVHGINQSHVLCDKWLINSCVACVHVSLTR